ncbi:MAG: glycosyltransferase [Candidatus Competibacteraceae bacterium]|nr:glycosyltransferase [Candidatus Competibacteraceae bacterium]MBK8964563.1 glycosyltransferase [Candidatus Competibacteraceae bacterium]MBK9952558.1 glycosyltransferase [Candidatus Competibacteraceae bacterium]
MLNDPPDRSSGSDRAIRSAHVIGGRLLGGAELFYARLVNALHRRGQTALAITSADSLIAGELWPDVPRAHVPMRGVWDWWSRWRLQKLLQTYRPQIVQTYMGRATRLTHLPVAPHLVHVARLGGYYTLKGYRHAHAWIGNTQGICDYLIRNDLPARRVFHIGNFILPREASSAEGLARRREQWQVPTDALLVVAVGRLHPVKGFDDLLNAFACLPTTLDGRPLYLIIVGDGPLALKLKHLSEQLDIASRVRWTGWRRDAGHFQEMADVIICPSRHEPLGNVILEAWAWRRPVIATRTLGPTEIAAHQDDAWLVPVADPAALAEALRLLLTDASLRASIAANGYRKVSTSYSEGAIVSAYLELYAYLLD